MKKVWVNRFNADGSAKPMSEWMQRECAERYTHTHPMANGEQGFDSGGLPNRNCFLTEFGTIRDSGRFFYEYIGNQRGDGWFYVEDGDLPPDNEAVLISDGVDCLYTEISTLTNHNALCWQPMQPPKFLSPQF